ncbi:MAG: hypothetical protein JXR68_12775 [Bacteroidales bacterium]|nr:hypothetical protein [Bacteroidales bacterium]
MKTTKSLTMPYESAIKYGFILIIVIIGVIIFSKIINAISKSADQRAAKKEVINSDLSYDKIRYTSFAKSLYQAMNGWGTDQDTVERIIKLLLTKSDYYYLESIYEDKDGTLTERLIYELEDNKKAQQSVYAHLASIGVYL